MNDNQTKLMRNAIGPAIFAFGAIAVVMVAMTVIKGMPSAEARGVDALARGLVGFMGAIPMALVGIGAALIGGRLFVVGLDLRLNRNLLGLLLVPLALAIFLSTILPDGGGVFGEAIGGKVRLQMHSAIAFAFGVVILVAPIWFVFVREYALQLMTEVNPPSAEQEHDVHAAGGLSREEADALLPEEEPASFIETEQKNEELAELLTTQKDERPEWLEKSSHPQAASPYAEDVRHKGEVPEGATPLATDDSQAHESSAQSSSIQRWAPESLRLAGDALGADLADEGPTEVRPELLQDREPEPEAEAEAVTPEPLAAVEPVAVVKPLVQAEREALPPAPSWEQSNLFEEPVQELEDEEELELAAEYEEEEEEELEEAAEYEEEDEEELEPAAEYEDEEEEELEEAAEYEEEDEEELESAAEYEEEEEEELEEAAEYEEEDEEELEPAAEYEEEEEEELEEAAELEEEPEAFVEVDEAPAEELAEAEPEMEVEALELEPEVVLTPQAPPVAETPEPAAPSEGGVSDQVVYDAGVLFLERERVAVSMLQREFNLDFDESCETMDKLQTMGLIGPYVGGHRRDILMTKDEWMERVTLP